MAEPTVMKRYKQNDVDDDLLSLEKNLPFFRRMRDPTPQLIGWNERNSRRESAPFPVSSFEPSSEREGMQE